MSGRGKGGKGLGKGGAKRHRLVPQVTLGGRSCKAMLVAVQLQRASSQPQSAHFFAYSLQQGAS